MKHFKPIMLDDSTIDNGATWLLEKKIHLKNQMINISIAMQLE